jgi:two-component system alkaline phosphatase synthesis response regulator PhoP
MTKVLVVDDEPAIATLLEYNLAKSGYAVETASDGLTAIALLADSDIDLVLLDVMLPGKGGVEVLRDLRGTGNPVPVIMITALDDEVDRILGLEMGADDYVTKPFSPREVIARIKAVLRRYEVGQDVGTVNDGKNIQRFGRLTIDFDRMAVQADGQLLRLTPKEYELLAYMATRSGRVLDRDTLLHAVWAFDASGPDTRMVDMHISHLREKVEPDPKNPAYLKTVRGFGYRFEVPEDAK